MATTVNMSGKGIRATITSKGTILELFSRRDQNSIVRTAMFEAGQMWRFTFLPLRFSNYAKRLGYGARSQWNELKRRRAANGSAISPQPTPFVFGGVKGQAVMRDTALAGARTVATATATRCVASIKIPFGHPILPRFAEVFATIPENEADAFLKVFVDTMDEIIDHGESLAHVRRGVSQTVNTPSNAGCISAAQSPRRSSAGRQRGGP